MHSLPILLSAEDCSIGWLLEEGYSMFQREGRWAGHIILLGAEETT